VTQFFRQNARLLLEENCDTILTGVAQFLDKIVVLYCV